QVAVAQMAEQWTHLGRWFPPRRATEMAQRRDTSLDKKRGRAPAALRDYSSRFYGEQERAAKSGCATDSGMGGRGVTSSVTRCGAEGAQVFLGCSSRLRLTGANRDWN